LRPTLLGPLRRVDLITPWTQEHVHIRILHTALKHEVQFNYDYGNIE